MTVGLNTGRLLSKCRHEKDLIQIFVVKDGDESAIIAEICLGGAFERNRRVAGVIIVH